MFAKSVGGYLRLRYPPTILSRTSMSKTSIPASSVHISCGVKSTYAIKESFRGTLFHAKCDDL